MARFNVTRFVAVLPLSFYVLGFLIGPLVAAPISELYGRLVIYRVTLPVLCMFTAIAGATNNFPLLVVARLLAGTWGSGALAVGAGKLHPH